MTTGNVLDSATYGASYRRCPGSELHYRDLSAAEIEEREKHQNGIFESIETFAQDIYHGCVKSLVVAGAAGMGKSHLVEHTFRRLDKEQGFDGEDMLWSFTKGHALATRVYTSLFDHRERGQVIVLDDADSAFADDIGVNILKAATDSKERRQVSWGTLTKFVSQKSGEIVPSRFTFEGAVVIITNKNLSELAGSDAARAEHIAAICDRSRVINVAIEAPLDRLVRIHSIYRKGGLFDRRLDKKQQQEVLSFLDEHLYDFRKLTVRRVGIIAENLLNHPKTWRTLTAATDFV